MKYELIILSRKQAEGICSSQEISMTRPYTGKVLLENGETYTVAIDNCMFIFYVEGYDWVPFSYAEIDKIDITNEKINMKEFYRRQRYVVEKGILDPSVVSRPEAGAILRIE